MITEDIKILENIFSIIDEDLTRKGYSYTEFEYSCLVYEEFGMTDHTITIKDKEQAHTDCSIDDPECTALFGDLHRNMKARGENWKSLILKFSGGKVNTRFSYEENPPPW
jgi:hypothetical protein